MNTRLNFNFPVPTKLYFGAGKLEMLHTLEMPGNKALVVISNGQSTRANGYLDRTLTELAQAKVQAIVYDKVMPNPTKECIEEGAFIARQNHCDFIVALGGGSVIDAETKARIRDARVVVDDNAAEMKTIWDGSFSTTQPFKQIKISKRGYLTRVMNYEERTDTIILLNDAKNLDEVVVWGKRPEMHMDFGGMCRDIARDTPQKSATGVGVSFDFLAGIDHLIHAKKYKRRKKAKKIMEQY